MSLTIVTYCISVPGKSKISGIMVRIHPHISPVRSMRCFRCTDGNLSVQKKFVRKEFNFGLQERLTGTDMPVEESDFKTEIVNANNNLRCVSSGDNRPSISLNLDEFQLSSDDLQRMIFGEGCTVVEQEVSLESNPSKRLKSTNSNEDDDDVRMLCSRSTLAEDVGVTLCFCVEPVGPAPSRANPPSEG